MASRACFAWCGSTTINAPPAKVFGYLNDFHRWTDWSPWERLDPNLQRTFTGPQSGVGSAYAWEGNKKVGQGRMEITESTAPSKVSLDLQFIKPFKGQNVTDFILETSGSGTKLTWDMHGPNQCIGRIMQVFCDMDAMIGKDFEQGLSNLKAAAEKP
ncbi:MAG: SRPBCC family protein [Planctomycetaceae bacterium]